MGPSGMGQREVLALHNFSVQMLYWESIRKKSNKLWTPLKAEKQVEMVEGANFLADKLAAKSIMSMTLSGSCGNVP